MAIRMIKNKLKILRVILNSFSETRSSTSVRSYEFSISNLMINLGTGPGIHRRIQILIF